MQAEQAGRDNRFTLLRWLLALSVIFSHSWPLALGSGTHEPLEDLTQGAIKLGSLAVYCFLVLSGFLVAKSLEYSRSQWSFLKKRLLRIYPGFIVVMLVQALVVVPLLTPENFTGYSLRQLGILAYNIFDLHGYGYPYGGLYTVFTNHPLAFESNGSLWTIRYEFVCYLVLMGLALLRQRWLMPLLALALVLPAAFHLAPPWNRVLTALLGNGEPWPRLLLHFLLGALAWRYRQHIAYTNKGALLALTLLLGSLLLTPECIRFAFAFGGAYLVLWFAQGPGAAGSRFARIPDYSYGIYLYGFLIQQLVVHALLATRPEWLQPLVLFAIAAPLSIAAGAASWYLVEERALRFKN